MTISITDAMIEAGARALATKYCGDPDELAHRWNPGLGALEQQAHPNWQDYAEDVRLALAAVIAAASAPDPMVVPLRMTWRQRGTDDFLVIGGRAAGYVTPSRDRWYVCYVNEVLPDFRTEYFADRDAAMRAIEDAVRALGVQTDQASASEPTDALKQLDALVWGDGERDNGRSDKN